MKTQCDKIQDKISGFIAGILPEKEMSTVQEHLGKCSLCKEYKDQLQSEDLLLEDLFEKLESDMARQEDEVIKAVEYCTDTGQIGIIALFRKYSESRFVKIAGVAAVILFLALNYIITLSWISEIKACIQLCS
ncbi:MAG: zf-HC2 domain-containing protein [Planctomycetota bacterium]|jgi:predicted anti-sigma-YlaC factor YlaD